MNLEAFFEKETWGSVVERERRLRIKLAVAAFAYEYEDESIISDAEFDKMCLQVNKTVDTGHKVCDSYFKSRFDPSTGQWIRHHPELDKIKTIYERYYRK